MTRRGCLVALLAMTRCFGPEMCPTSALPFGSPCADDDDCQGEPFDEYSVGRVCVESWPDGYCVGECICNNGWLVGEWRVDEGTDVQAACISHVDARGQTRILALSECADRHDCRPGYSCRPAPWRDTYCMPLSIELYPMPEVPGCIDHCTLLNECDLSAYEQMGTTLNTWWADGELERYCKRSVCWYCPDPVRLSDVGARQTAFQNCLDSVVTELACPAAFWCFYLSGAQL